MKYILTMCAVLLLMLAGCGKEEHESEFTPAPGNGIFLTGIVTEMPGTEVKDVHIFIFGSDDQLVNHSYFADPQEASLRYTELISGHYTVIAVLNTRADFMPPSSRTELPVVSLADFTVWLNSVADEYSDMLTGSTQVELSEGEVKRITILVKSGTSGINLATLKLRITLPSPSLPAYTRAADNGYTLRCVADVYKAGTEKCLHRRQAILSTDADGKYTLDLGLPPGNYDLSLWIDYVPRETTADYNYSTGEGLNFVSLFTAPYRANSDSKDAFYACHRDIVLSAPGTTLNINTERPLAKYHLVATDVAKYRNLIQSANYPSLEDITIRVKYEGYFPSGFNVTSGKPNGAVDGAKITYSKTLATVAATDNEVQVGSDWVLVNGTESFVNATVYVIGKDGKVISQVKGVKIDYKRGYLTTVKGDFLTAGKIGGGINIDTSWGDEILVEF